MTEYMNNSSNNRVKSEQEMLEESRTKLTDELNHIIQSLHSHSFTSVANTTTTGRRRSSNTTSSSAIRKNVFANVVRDANQVLIELINFFDNIHNTYTSRPVQSSDIYTKLYSISNNDNTNNKINKVENKMERQGNSSEQNLVQVFESFAAPNYASQTNKPTSSSSSSSQLNEECKSLHAHVQGETNNNIHYQ